MKKTTGQGRSLEENSRPLRVCSAPSVHGPLSVRRPGLPKHSVTGALVMELHESSVSP